MTTPPSVPKTPARIVPVFECDSEPDVSEMLLAEPAFRLGTPEPGDDAVLDGEVGDGEEGNKSDRVSAVATGTVMAFSDEVDVRETGRELGDELLLECETADTVVGEVVGEADDEVEEVVVVVAFDGDPAPALLIGFTDDEAEVGLEEDTA